MTVKPVKKKSEKLLLSMDGKILDNESVFVPGHPKWGILGTDDPSSGNVGYSIQHFSEVEKYEKTILVTHTPSLFRKVEHVIPAGSYACRTYTWWTN